MIPSNFSAIAILAVLVLALSGIYLKFKTRIASRYSRPLAIFAIVTLVSAGGGIVSAQLAPNPFPLNNITSLPPITTGDPTPANPPLLTAVAVPAPTNLGEFVVAGQENTSLLQFGKSLFWDQQLGSDGVQSCATCHFNAGADSRSKNQLSPGIGTNALPNDITFQLGGPNYQLKATDFPFHRLTDPNQPVGADLPGGGKNVVTDINDVSSSQGVFNTTLKSISPGQAEEMTTSVADPNGFQVNGINVRRGEPRNTPTVINAIFNKLQFWDGRAKETFNGVNTKGAADLTAKVFIASGRTTLTQVSISLNNSSMASLVTDPPLSTNELSASGRTLPQIGSKFFRKRGQLLKSLRPLGQQVVASDDSVLGGTLSRFPNKGLSIGAYDRLLRQAFKPQWWRSRSVIQVESDGTLTILPGHLDYLLTDSEEGVTLEPNQFSLRDWNFSLFAGLAMQKYISTLVADQTPFDKFQAGDTTALTAQEQRGLALFVGSTSGTPTTPPLPGAAQGANCNTCHTIPEFTRASARRAAGVASTDAGNPLITNAAFGFFLNYGIRPASEDPGAGETTQSATTGSRFKAPTLRNIGLTAPYMHNGGMGTLEQVVQFYNRGRADDGGNRAALLGLDNTEQADLVAFLRTGLTDERVLLEKAPFDHPELRIPNGHPGNQFSVTASPPDANDPDGFPKATDRLVLIPAVGRNGVTTPQKKFLE